jgi:hypothetical protein
MCVKNLSSFLELRSLFASAFIRIILSIFEPTYGHIRYALLSASDAVMAFIDLLNKSQKLILMLIQARQRTNQ